MKKKYKEWRPLYDDVLFKEGLAKKENRKVLEYFLETFLDLTPGMLHNKLHVVYESPIEKWGYYEKAMREDLLVYFENFVFNIEVYTNFDKENYEKTICYAFKTAANIQSGAKYKESSAFIQLVFVHHFGISFNKNVINKYLITNTKSLFDTLSEDKFQIYYYRLDNAWTYNYNGNTKLRLLHFIEAGTKEERTQIAKGDELLMEFDKNLNAYVMDQKTKKFFAEWDMQIYEHQAERRGEERGEKRGEERGKEIGKKQGIVETAKKMLTENIPLATVIKCTGLSKEEIQKIR